MAILASGLMFRLYSHYIYEFLMYLYGMECRKGHSHYQLFA